MMDNNMTIVDMTIVEAEETLGKIAELEKVIRGNEQKRDALIAHYQEKIQAAETICDRDSAQARVEIALLTEQLKRYAENNLDGNKKSIAFPSGKLAFRKQPTRFFFDDMQEARSTDERLIKFAKANAPEFVKITETVAWDKLKQKLVVDGEEVFYNATGELINGLRAQVQPDKFTVTTM